MTALKVPRIELNPSKTQRIDFDSFVSINIPSKRAGKLRLAFKLIWIAHQVYPVQRGIKGLRVAHYLNLKTEIEEKLSKERNEDVCLDITRNSIESALRHMRKDGYLRYSPGGPLLFLRQSCRNP